jgi:hypothetical protein
LIFGNLDELDWSKADLPYPMEFHEKKSGWVKRNYKWKKPLKFLGLEIKEGELRANTKKGSRLIYNLEDLVELWDKGKLREDSISYIKRHNPERIDKDSLMELANSMLLGMIQNRLYVGRYNSMEIEQSFELTFCRSSWVEKHLNNPRRPYVNMNVFNSTSFASHNLLQICKRIRKENPKGPFEVGKWDNLDNYQVECLLNYSDHFMATHMPFDEELFKLWNQHNEPNWHNPYVSL